MNKKKHNLSIFIFRRDLRFFDNTALIKALENSVNVLPCFIFDPRQIDKHSYFSENALQFMLDSLKALQKEILPHKIHFFYGIAEQKIAELIKKYQAQAVYLNLDYTPFSKTRDENIKKICLHNKIKFYGLTDYVLNNPYDILTKNATAYKNFSAFFKVAINKTVSSPQKNKLTNFYNKPIQVSIDFDLFKESILPLKNKHIFLNGGRKNALLLLAKLKTLKDYTSYKDYPAKDYTSHLSAHLKFGTLSIREVYYYALNNMPDSKEFIRQLYWRDFFSYLANHYPCVFMASFNKKYDYQWQKNTKALKAWQAGKTGYPLIDAGMRQLNKTGFMPNRLRMLTASFLVKNLKVHWQEGEKYFATKLVDYDPAINNGNWQWVASTGATANPIFRVFNPLLQQKKYDNDCLYIKKWVQELSDIDNKTIHNFVKQAMPNYAKIKL